MQNKKVADDFTYTRISIETDTCFDYESKPIAPRFIPIDFIYEFQAKLHGVSSSEMESENGTTDHHIVGAMRGWIFDVSAALNAGLDVDALMSNGENHPCCNYNYLINDAMNDTYGECWADSSYLSKFAVLGALEILPEHRGQRLASNMLRSLSNYLGDYSAIAFLSIPQKRTDDSIIYYDEDSKRIWKQKMQSKDLADQEKARKKLDAYWENVIKSPYSGYNGCHFDKHEYIGYEEKDRSETLILVTDDHAHIGLEEARQEHQKYFNELALEDQ